MLQKLESVHGTHVVVYLAIDCGGMKKEQCSRYVTKGTNKDNAPSKETLQRRKNELKAKAKAKAKKRSDVNVKKNLIDPNVV